MAFHPGKRDGENTRHFIATVRHATSPDQLFDVSTDAFAPYEAGD